MTGEDYGDSCEVCSTFNCKEAPNVEQPDGTWLCRLCIYLVRPCAVCDGDATGGMLLGSGPICRPCCTKMADALKVVR